ncbi:benzoate 4-monooxygenase cytochrome p450 [Colletotrichum truncatum]|uniref:Benzoate 4-monooxygenase cytochrome p450 n=1 Tax=Colletotrichum truncatum TaxID=5467 RepID=A0ACC3YRU2_COLTU|nr:benzoate 4-monooxygenase cytochrome p450 [Colletotrichum truncatum]KAF6799361.1 benzoate 4-monooxygenase cytochrome p450 [Colletotrichum truncatum]
MLYSLYTATSVAALVLTIYLIICRIRDYARLRHVPGPFWAHWTDLWLIKAQLSGKLAFTLQDLHNKHGPIVRIAPNWVVVGDGATMRRLWAARSPWKRGAWYRGLRFDPYSDSVFTALDDKQHDSMRAKLAPGYAGKDVEGVQELVDEQVAGLINLLETRYLSTEHEFKTVDLARKVQYFTLDVISAVGFGKKFGYLDSDADTLRYIEVTERSVPSLLVIALQPWMLNILQSRTLRPIVPDVTKIMGIGDVIRRAREAVNERYGENPVVKRDILGSFVTHGLTREQAEGETTVQIVAGSDTTAAAIRSTMLFIITNPHVYTRLQAEIDQAAKQGLISSPITDAEARRFEYLQAVIKEGLRIWPPGTGLLPKVSLKDELMGETHIPAGTNVAWSPFSVTHEKEVFGPDAGMFRPERWLGISKEKYRMMETQTMLLFAGGSRFECLGKNLAMMELNKVYVELLRRFDFTIVNPAIPWTSENYAIHIQREFNVKITRRSKPV